MKTQLLEWDIKMQVVLLVVTTCLAAFARPTVIVILVQAAVVAYMLGSDVLHLALQHKSLGYTIARKYFLPVEVMYILLAIGSAAGLFKWLSTGSHFLSPVLAVTAPLLLFVYFIFSRRELHQIRHREFFILK